VYPKETAMKSAKRLSRTGRQRSLLFCLAAGLGLFAAKNASAAEYYVSPTGSDSNAGTQASPFATVQKANNSASAGDTIWMRGGTYSTTGQITLSKSGTSDTNRTKIWAYAGEVPILDFSNYSLASSSSDKPAITVTGSWMHLKGLEIGPAKVGSSGSHSYSLLRTSGSASNNTFELLNIHNGFGPGLFIDTGNGGNLILNCDSHDNYDVNGSQGDGQNGDGFGVHYQTSGPSTIIRGCRAWGDADDGYDLISQEVPVTVENNWALGIGVGGGNGNGFKMGSSKTGIRHVVQNNVAWKCKASGFYANHSAGGNNWYNNTSYNNGTQYNLLASSFDSSGVTGTIILSGAKAHVMRNNIGFPNDNTNMGGVDTANNTWDLNITPAASDFASISDTGCTGPRAADGSLPSACAMLKLTAGSKMIDKGKDVGLPFVGTAPDLGAYEYGAATPAGTGGTSGGTGGSMSTGGSASTGGSSGTGGRSGTGGITTGSGGATGTGGRSGGGGTTVLGGGPGSGGGTSVLGGAPGTGGGTAVGGTSGSGGGSAVGGGTGTGGTSTTGGKTGSNGTGGVVVTGGLVGTGGSTVATGGSVTTGGAVVTGGLPASGGVSSTVPLGTGGSVGTGGTSGPGVTGGSTSATGTTQASSGGCSCRIAGAHTNYSGLALLGLVTIALRLRRRR
jgi:MYXO-CTERM domain-containing protein